MNFNSNSNINLYRGNSSRGESRYNLKLFLYITNKLRKKDRYFKYLKKKYLLYILNAFYKNKSQLIEKQIIIILIKINMKPLKKALFIYNQ